MKNKIVIFDLDGVIVDSANYVLNFFLETYPALTKEKMNDMLMGNFPTEIEKLKLTHKPIEESEEQNKIRNKAYSEKKAQLPLFSGIKELLESLHEAKCILVVNTSAIEKNCIPILENTGILKLFDFIASKEISKDKTEKFRMISEKYSTSTDQMVFVTDTLGDLREADHAGVPTIAVTYGAHNSSYFEREEHTNLVKIVASVKELSDYLSFWSKNH